MCLVQVYISHLMAQLLSLFPHFLLPCTHAAVKLGQILGFGWTAYHQTNSALCCSTLSCEGRRVVGLLSLVISLTLMDVSGYQQPIEAEPPRKTPPYEHKYVGTISFCFSEGFYLENKYHPNNIFNILCIITSNFLHFWSSAIKTDLPSLCF